MICVQCCSHCIKGLYGLVQVGRTWNNKLNGHMEGVGYATMKGPVVYVKNSWNEADFAAAGYWVDNFISIGAREELDGVWT